MTAKKKDLGIDGVFASTSLKPVRTEMADTSCKPSDLL